MNDLDLTLQLIGLTPEKNDRYSWGDLGNGRLFADIFKDKARYVPERNKFFVFEGGVWRPDLDDLKVHELCKMLADALVVYALSLDDEKSRRSYLDFVSKWQRRSYRETIVKDSASIYPVCVTKFDVYPFLFNCANGTLNLDDFSFSEHNPDDFLSKAANVVFNPEARCERWERHISEVMLDDTAKSAYLQKSFGYSLSGDTSQECFFILYGPSTRNGKGTTVETILHLMGDYGVSAKPETVMQKQSANSSGPSEDIARLAGARFVSMAEPDKRMVFNTSLVNTLTGNDTMTARYLHENSFKFKPLFKLFINTNHLPAITDMTVFLSNRVRVIPFDRHFSEREQDKGLKAELTNVGSLSGILNWCLDGLRLIRETGFDSPESVVAAVSEYRGNSDKLGRFINEEMEVDSLAETRTAEAYTRFKQWCAANGYRAENAANFKSSLNNVAEIVRKRPHGSGRSGEPTPMILGYRLKPDSDDFQQELPMCDDV